MGTLSVADMQQGSEKRIVWLSNLAFFTLSRSDLTHRCNKKILLSGDGTYCLKPGLAEILEKTKNNAMKMIYNFSEIKEYDVSRHRNKIIYEDL